MRPLVRIEVGRCRERPCRRRGSRSAGPCRCWRTGAYDTPPADSLKITLRQLVAACGRTQASRVRPFVEVERRVVGHGDDVVLAVERERAAEAAGVAARGAVDRAVVTAALVERSPCPRPPRSRRTRPRARRRCRPSGCRGRRARAAGAVERGHVHLDRVAGVAVARLRQVERAAGGAADRGAVAEPLVAVAHRVAVGVREPARRGGHDVVGRRGVGLARSRVPAVGAVLATVAVAAARFARAPPGSVADTSTLDRVAAVAVARPARGRAWRPWRRRWRCRCGATGTCRSARRRRDRGSRSAWPSASGWSSGCAARERRCPRPAWRWCR